MKIQHFLILGQSILGSQRVGAFQCQTTGRFRNAETELHFSRRNNDGKKNPFVGIASLWEEVIEMSTYGPSERKMLKARREKQMNTAADGGEKTSQAITSDDGTDVDGPFALEGSDDDAWIRAFAAAKNKSNRDDENEKLDYDGYALRDLLLSKWGVPLDVDFQRIGGQVYCTVLPAVGHGGGPLQSRHDSELDYLMHLQGVVEVLHKYDNLRQFVAFVEGTDRVPKRGTDSVPFRLSLSGEDLDKIMNS